MLAYIILTFDEINSSGKSSNIIISENTKKDNKI